MKTIRYEKSFKKNIKKIKKRGKDLNELKIVIEMLMNDVELPIKYHDHTLSGKYAKIKECHIEPDWLLMYKTENNELTLVLIRTGSHSDLF